MQINNTFCDHKYIPPQSVKEKTALANAHEFWFTSFCLCQTGKMSAELHLTIVIMAQVQQQSPKSNKELKTCNDPKSYTSSSSSVWNWLCGTGNTEFRAVLGVKQPLPQPLDTPGRAWEQTSCTPHRTESNPNTSLEFHLPLVLDHKFGSGDVSVRENHSFVCSYHSHCAFLVSLSAENVD